jgi:hypothetical protein
MLEGDPDLGALNRQEGRELRLTQAPPPPRGLIARALRRGVRRGVEEARQAAVR